MAATCSTGQSRANVQVSSPGSLIRFSGQVLRQWGQEMHKGWGGEHAESWRSFVCSQALRTNQTDSARVNRIKGRVSPVCPSFPKEAYRPPARAGKVPLSPPPPKFFYILSDTSGHLWVIVLFYDRHMKRVHIKVSFCLCRNSIF